MHFHEFINFRSKVRSHGPSHSAPQQLIEAARTQDLESFYRIVGQSSLQYALSCRKEGDEQQFKSFFSIYAACVREVAWLVDKRPFVNVWPIIVELLPTVTLRIRWSQIVWPHETMVFRFARGHEPYGLSSAIISNRRRELDPTHDMFACVTEPNAHGLKTFHGLSIATQFVGDRFGPWIHPFDLAVDCDGFVSDQVDEIVARNRHESAQPGNEKYGLFNDVLPFVCQLSVFTALAWSGEDLVTPILLKKDQPKWQAADEESRKWMLQRAERLLGRGVELGRVQQEKKETSPHWRNPHLCLFWTGLNRETPVIKIRNGGIVSRKPIVSIPTGYIGEETPEERDLDARCTVRVQISKAKRFEIFRRDGYRCQLCGTTAQGGVAMHIDHRIPVSKGGTNEDGNLWLLCEPCNLGKSSRHL